MVIIKRTELKIIETWKLQLQQAFLLIEHNMIQDT